MVHPPTETRRGRMARRQRGAPGLWAVRLCGAHQPDLPHQRRSHRLPSHVQPAGPSPALLAWILHRGARLPGHDHMVRLFGALRTLERARPPMAVDPLAGCSGPVLLAAGEGERDGCRVLVAELVHGPRHRHDHTALPHRLGNGACTRNHGHCCSLHLGAMAACGSRASHVAVGAGGWRYHAGALLHLQFSPHVERRLPLRPQRVGA